MTGADVLKVAAVVRRVVVKNRLPARHMMDDVTQVAAMAVVDRYRRTGIEPAAAFSYYLTIALREVSEYIGKYVGPATVSERTACRLPTRPGKPVAVIPRAVPWPVGEGASYATQGEGSRPRHRELAFTEVTVDARDPESLAIDGERRAAAAQALRKLRAVKLDRKDAASLRSIEKYADADSRFKRRGAGRAARAGVQAAARAAAGPLLEAALG